MPRFRLLAPLRGSTPRQWSVSVFAVTPLCRFAQNDTVGMMFCEIEPIRCNVTLMDQYCTVHVTNAPPCHSERSGTDIENQAIKSKRRGVEPRRGASRRNLGTYVWHCKSLISNIHPARNDTWGRSLQHRILRQYPAYRSRTPLTPPTNRAR